MAGLTLQGFQKKTLDEIKTEIETLLRQTFGNGLNVLPNSFLGELIGTIAEREALIWELQEAIYNGFFPDNAQGLNLDNVVAITGIKRLEATKGTGEGVAYGVLDTVIPEGSVISVAGNSTARFKTIQDYTIGAGTDEVQTIQFSAVPDAGNWTLVFDGEETGTLLFNDNAATVESALNALSGLGGVTVTGDYTSGFEVTFTGSNGELDQPLLIIGVNTLENTSIAVSVSFTETTKGVLPNVTCELIAESAGEIPAFANSLTVIETPIGGWQSFNNPTDITPGKNIETDAELRIRRLKTLANPGASTIDSIRAKLLEIPEVEDARVFENDTDVTDGFGRPPHSIECVVLEGDDQEIRDTIWASKAGGIETYGSVTGTISDSMGFTHTVDFSRPTPITIYISVENLEINSLLFPIDGDEAIKQALATFGTGEFSIGDDVIYNKLHCAIAEIAGVIDYDLFIDTTPAPAAEDNIDIQDDEVASFDTSNITVTFL